MTYLQVLINISEQLIAPSSGDKGIVRCLLGCDVFAGFYRRFGAGNRFHLHGGENAVCVLLGCDILVGVYQSFGAVNHLHLHGGENVVRDVGCDILAGVYQRFGAVNHLQLHVVLTTTSPP